MPDMSSELVGLSLQRADGGAKKVISGVTRSSLGDFCSSHFSLFSLMALFCTFWACLALKCKLFIVRSSI